MEKRLLDEVLPVEEVMIDKGLVFIENKFVHYAGAGWRGQHALKDIR